MFWYALSLYSTILLFYISFAREKSSLFMHDMSFFKDNFQAQVKGQALSASRKDLDPEQSIL